MKNASAMYANAVPNIVEQTKNALLQSNLNYQKDLNEVAVIVAKNLAGREKEIGDGMAQIYANEFTEQELKDLVTFYKIAARPEAARQRAAGDPVQHGLYECSGRRISPKSSTSQFRGRDEEARQARSDRRADSRDDSRATEAAMAEFDVDLFVIGGGSGGVRAARIAAGHGARVMVAEEYRMGGTCVIRGCVPKKLFVIGSHVHHEIEDAAGFGWTIPEVDLRLADADRQQGQGDRAAGGRSTPPMSRKSARAVVKTRAVFEDAAHAAPCRRREGDGEIHPDRDRRRAQSRRGNSRHRARDLLQRGVSSDELPKRIVIQGGGYIALEFAGIFAGFGSDVTRDLSRRQHLARLRRGRPHPCPRRDGKAGHHHHHRLHDRPRSTSTARNSPRICRTDPASPPTR